MITQTTIVARQTINPAEEDAVRQLFASPALLDKIREAMKENISELLLTDNTDSYVESVSFQLIEEDSE